MVEMTLDISPRVKATEALKKVRDEQEQIIRESAPMI